jgi:LysM repeat protein
MSSSISPFHTAAPELYPSAVRKPHNALISAVLLLVVAVVLGGLFYVNATDAGRAHRLATQELRARLDSGEAVQRTAFVTQRHWWDYYRATHGVLASTDRRVLFVGVTPEFNSSPDDPPVFDVKSFPYDTLMSIGSVEVRFSPGRGVRVASGGRDERFGVAPGEGRRLLAVARDASRHDLAIRERLRREQRYHDSLAALPPIREYYRVQRGDALDVIARRYGTTADALRSMNNLETDRIKAGQQLLVKVSPHPITPCPPELCEVSVSAGGEVAP